MVIIGVDPKDLAQTGWGVIFAHNADPAIREALQELLNLRRQQATKQQEHRYQEFTGADGYRPNESKQDFLGRHRAGPGPVDPDRVPYYLLIVGDPETIPYRFQYQLGVQYAIGRIHFETVEEYASYARSVVTAEAGQLAPSRQAAFFGVRHPDDSATALSVDNMVQPLADHINRHNPDWTVRTLLAEQATKAQLGRLIGGEDSPSLLFTASHGMGFPLHDPRQLSDQGALLCQDWPGPKQWRGSVPPDFYFGADDVRDDARLLGMITFHFASYSAGTPRTDDFAGQAFSQQTIISPYAFVARLPQRLLSHPRGGILAFVGQAGRAWGYSFKGDQASRQSAAYQGAIKRLLENHPVGSALEYISELYTNLSTELSRELDDIRFGKVSDDIKLCGMWTANNDARTAMVIGDPAVRLFC